MYRDDFKKDTSFFVNTILLELCSSSRMAENSHYIQHGSTSILEHCRRVALISLRFSRRLHLKVDERSLVRGALLHDYFLYDWHFPDVCPRWHGFVHPKIALENARRDIPDLNKTEEDIIHRHMFPLTPCPPRTREGIIVSLADKVSGFFETIKINEGRVFFIKLPEALVNAIVKNGALC